MARSGCGAESQPAGQGHGGPAQRQRADHESDDRRDRLPGLLPPGHAQVDHREIDGQGGAHPGEDQPDGQQAGPGRAARQPAPHRRQPRSDNGQTDGDGEGHRLGIGSVRMPGQAPVVGHPGRERGPLEGRHGHRDGQQSQWQQPCQ